MQVPTVIFRFIAVAVMALVVAACGDKSDMELVADAKALIDKKDDKAAVIQLKAALQRNPDLAEARYLLGTTLLRGGEATGAAVELQKALDLKQPGNVVVPALAEALLLSGDAKKVVAVFGATSLPDAKAAAALKSMVASAYQVLGDTASSSAAIDAALQLDPANSTAQLLNARRAAMRGDVDGALTLVNAAIAANPRLTAALLFKGDVLGQSKGDVEGAIDAYKKALAVDARSVPGHAALIRVLLQKRDMAGYRAQIATLKSLWPNYPATRFFEAQLALLDRDFPRARSQVQLLLQTAANDPTVLQLAGAIEFQAGALKPAEAHLVKALQFAPDMVLARQLLAETHIRSGQPAKALLTLQPLLEQKQPAAETLALAGQASLQTGNLAKAEQFYTLAAQADPSDQRSPTALALTQISRGDAAAGFARLESLAVGDKTAYADLALITARLQSSDLSEALKAIDRLATKAGDKALPHLLRARVLVVQKDLKGARAALEKAIAADPVNFPATQDLASIDLAENRPDDARKRYEALLSHDPKNHLALLSVAELRQKAGEKPEQIEALLLDVVKNNPTEAVPRVVLVEHRLSRYQAKAAMAAAQDGLAMAPESIPLQDALGRAQLAAGDVRQAMGTFNKIAASRPLDPQPLLRLAEAHLWQNETALAAQTLRRALQIKPDLVAAQRGLVKVALLGKRTDEALQMARLVQKQRPREAVGYQMEGEIHLNQRNNDAALAAFRTALVREPTTVQATRVHALSAGAGRMAEADRFAEGWLRTNPSDAGFMFYLGSAALAQSDLTAAEARYRQVLTHQPENAASLNNLAWILVKQGKPGALQLAEQAVKLTPTYAPFLDTLAMALAFEKQWAKAIEWQNKALAMAPEAHGMRLHLARLLVGSGDSAGAKVELDKLSALGTSFEGQAEVKALRMSL